MAAVSAPHRIDHGGFCVWKYNGPSKRAHGFWYGDNPITQSMWAYALRSKDGTFWETSRARGGFADEESAVTAARVIVAERGIISA